MNSMTSFGLSAATVNSGETNSITPRVTQTDTYLQLEAWSSLDSA